MQPPQQVTIDFNNGKRYQATQYQSIFIDAPALMAELHRNSAALEIPIITKHIAAWHEIDENLIFNCSGMQAKMLTHDPRIVPVQGHLISLMHQVDANQLQYMLNFRVTMHDLKHPRDELIYFAPKNEGILGITFIRGQDSITANLHEFDRLLQRSRDFFGT